MNLSLIAVSLALQILRFYIDALKPDVNERSYYFGNLSSGYLTKRL